ncbi:hypothetical protein AAHA92_00276 [Salvia divinorum]|uniref:Uncharacterized protein n=1 Tax=Salvia divinorum TaxID=28513 RepID=A0ABD1IJ06_SALDI
MSDPRQFIPSTNSSQGTQGSNQYRRTSYRNRRTCPLYWRIEAGEHSSSNTQKEPSVAKKANRKRKGTDEGEGLLKLLGKLHAETNARLDTLSTHIGYKMDLGKARQEIFRHLDNISGLSDAQKYDICDIIGKENSRLEIFMGLPDMKKPGYVIRVMEKEHLL